MISYDLYFGLSELTHFTYRWFLRHHLDTGCINCGRAKYKSSRFTEKNFPRNNWISWKAKPRWSKKRNGVRHFL